MMVCGPSRSGKTKWTVRLLKERHDIIQPTIDGILFCYSQWQPSYDELKKTVPSVHFHQGPPSLKTMESLQNGILVLDDLMEEVIKDINIMNMFIVGSHHKSISVLFLMQNIFQKGPHSRTISINTQYMTLFKNARDQTQIRILARQIFPSDWRSFLKYYEDETNKAYGHVILDFHPTTHNDDRIVKFHRTEETVSNDENVSENKSFQIERQQNEVNNEQEHSVVTDSLTKQQHILETIQQSIYDLKQEDVVVRDFQNKQHQDMELIRQSIYDLKQETMRSKIEEDFIARNFQKKQNQNIELIHQSILELKQSARRGESAVDMVETKTQQSPMVTDDVKKNAIEYKPHPDEEKLLKIFHDHGVSTDIINDKEPIDWTAPL